MPFSGLLITLWNISYLERKTKSRTCQFSCGFSLNFSVFCIGIYAFGYNHASQLPRTPNKRKFLFSGIVFFTIRWWDPTFFESMHPDGTGRRASWPYVESKSFLWTWLFLVPLAAYSLWQALYLIIVNVLRRQRLLRDPEVMTSYRFSCMKISTFQSTLCYFLAKQTQIVVITSFLHFLSILLSLER